MMTCVGQPVSWLRLEQYALDELDKTTRAAVDAHLSGCDACRASLTHITDDPWRLPALEPVATPARSNVLAWLMGSGVVAVAAVLALVLLRTGGPDGAADIPGPRVAIKGAGVVAIDLVRERDGSTALDPGRYQSGDRFKVLVTCAPGSSLFADVVVYQDGEAAFPMSAQSVPCGNQVALGGAFRVTGTTPFTVCTTIGDGAAPDRSALGKRRDPRGMTRTACTRVVPAP